MVNQVHRMIPPYPAACQRLPEADPTFPYLCLYSSGRKYNTRVDSDLINKTVIMFPSELACVRIVFVFTFFSVSQETVLLLYTRYRSRRTSYCCTYRS